METPVALSSNAVVEALHVMAVLAAYGLPLAYPLLVPYVRRRHPSALPAVHSVQHRLNLCLTAPGTVLIFAFGAYLAASNHLWGKVWVDVPLAIIGVIALLGGWVVRATGRLAELARDVAQSRAYDSLYRRYLAAETLLGALVLTAVFFMSAKPFD